MRGSLGQSLHRPIDSYSHCIYRERSHHADYISLEKGINTACRVLLPKCLHHALILELSELVRLHQSLHIVKRIVEHPIRGTTNTTSDKGHIEGYIVGITAYWSESLGDRLD